MLNEYKSPILSFGFSIAGGIWSLGSHPLPPLAWNVLTADVNNTKKTAPKFEGSLSFLFLSNSHNALLPSPCVLFSPYYPKESSLHEVAVGPPLDEPAISSASPRRTPLRKQQPMQKLDAAEIATFPELSERRTGQGEPPPRSRSSRQQRAAAREEEYAVRGAAHQHYSISTRSTRRTNFL